MQIQETFTVDAPPATVWKFFEDIERVARCVPGVQSVDVLGPDRYKVLATQKVGFISATFEIYTEVLEKEAPSRLVLSNQGRTILGANGSLKSRDTIILTPAPGDATEVKVDSELTLGGKLAILGAKLIEAKSREIFAEATSNLRAKASAA